MIVPEHLNSCRLDRIDGMAWWDVWMGWHGGINGWMERVTVVEHNSFVQFENFVRVTILHIECF